MNTFRLHYTATIDADTIETMHQQQIHDDIFASREDAFLYADYMNQWDIGDCYLHSYKIETISEDGTSLGIEELTAKDFYPSLATE
jgi:hypothetical protein